MSELIHSFPASLSLHTKNIHSVQLQLKARFELGSSELKVRALTTESASTTKNSQFGILWQQRKGLSIFSRNLNSKHIICRLQKQKKEKSRIDVDVVDVGNYEEMTGPPSSFFLSFGYFSVTRWPGCLAIYNNEKLSKHIKCAKVGSTLYQVLNTP